MGFQASREGVSWRTTAYSFSGDFVMADKRRVEIEYCIGCKWLLRAAWLAQELLTTFEQDLSEVALIPGQTGGIFEIRIGGRSIWSRKERGHFPEAKELKQLVRDIVAPGRELGHVDRP
jgi:selenoprotein W-related protein